MYFVMGIFRKEKGKNFIIPRLLILKDEQLFEHEEFEDFAKYYLQEMIDVPFDVLSPEEQLEFILAYCDSRAELFVQPAPHSKDVPAALEVLKLRYMEACSQLAD